MTFFRWFIRISIHALVKRATKFHICFSFLIFYFNPRPREEGDIPALDVSFISFYFNPRPREEGDFLNHFLSEFVFRFQSTPS